jgi:hypothetical protein
LFGRNAFVFCHFSYDDVLLFDDLLGCEVIDEFVVLAWQGKSVFKLFNLVLFLLDYLL